MNRETEKRTAARPASILHLSSLIPTLQRWFREEGYWYATSAVVHAIAFVILALFVSFVPGLLPATGGDSQSGDAPAIESVAEADDQPPDLANFVLGGPQDRPSSINTDVPGPIISQGGPPIYIDDSPDFEAPGGGMAGNLAGPELGGLGGFTVQGIPGIGGPGGVGVGTGTGPYPGSGGGAFPGFGPRGQGNRPGGMGGTQATDNAVSGGLVWLSRHQGTNGAWSLQHSQFCPNKKQGCSGQGVYQSDVAATALALLPFLGYGHTHVAKGGPFYKHVSKGLSWLISQQGPDGSLARRSGTDEFGELKPMYTHALATIVLCEAYGMTRDQRVRDPAIRAVRFIEAAQNQSLGAWRYLPQVPEGDTSVVGWQVMALKSAQMAGLGVDSLVLEGPRKWLQSVATGRSQGLFRYQPYRAEEPSMTAVGQLCLQYMGSRPDDAALQEGKEYLLRNMPDSNLQRDIYYWYYATLVLHNYLDQDFDHWDRVMRKILVNTQVREGCGMGSWDPDQPTMDRWGSAGGRLYMTSFSILTLEVYYRYLPLFKLGRQPVIPEVGTPKSETRKPKQTQRQKSE